MGASAIPCLGASAASTVDGAACPATASEVVMIGDSYLALSGETTKHLESLATAAGALASGSSYRALRYYADGANMYPYSAFPTPIPTQFSSAVTASSDIKYVIMDGGGNDILIENPQCITVSPDAGPISSACEQVVSMAITTASSLFQTMKTAGVGEGHLLLLSAPSDDQRSPSVDVMMDYAYPLIEQACESAAIPCSFIDTRPAFQGHPEYIGLDNIHPTTAGSDVIAGLIWGVMQQECIALAP